MCVACHALHHVGCLQGHGACAACGAAHPRFARREVPVEARTARTEGAKEAKPPLTAAILLLSALGAALALPTAQSAEAIAMDVVVLVAALVGSLAAAKRGALFGWTCFSMAVSGGLFLLLSSVRGVPAAERQEVMTSAFALLAVSAALGAAHILGRRTSAASADPAKNEE